MRIHLSLFSFADELTSSCELPSASNTLSTYAIRTVATRAAVNGKAMIRPRVPNTLPSSVCDMIVNAGASDVVLFWMSGAIRLPSVPIINRAASPEESEADTPVYGTIDLPWN